jgi:signal transduction histidine kinase
VTALGKLVRTTAFKILAVYLVIFALFSVGVIAYLARHTEQLVVEQIAENIDSEVRSLTLQYRIGGISRLVDAVDLRAQQPGSGLYLVTTFSGDTIAGNVSNVPTGTLDQPGWSEIAYHREGVSASRDSRAIVRVSVLPGGFRLVVGRDFEERERLRQVLYRPAGWSAVLIVIMGLAGGVFVTRRVLRRIEAMTATSDRIMTGDLSGRLPVSGTDDEFDRLANGLNAMLERIEALMIGMKHVSDNIAHDLKTPLTRLRNRAEEALRSARTDADWRAALEATIEESDGLIRTFDALLMIARAEAGQAREGMTDLDLADVAHSVAELYEPLAEEQNLRIVTRADAPLFVHGHRELIGQALANLIDNAIKYGTPEQPDTVGEIEVTARREDHRAILCVSDRGPGIPEADRPRVVERFVRLEASRSRPGAGLGLSLAAAVAHLHGAELRIEDNHPGTKVILALPAVDGPAGPAA